MHRYGHRITYLCEVPLEVPQKSGACASFDRRDGIYRVRGEGTGCESPDSGANTSHESSFTNANERIRCESTNERTGGGADEQIY